jgi:hypothetical protein
MALPSAFDAVIMKMAKYALLLASPMLIFLILYCVQYVRDPSKHGGPKSAEARERAEYKKYLKSQKTAKDE